MPESEYNVVFVYTEDAGGYEGNMTWTTFDSKEAFDEWYTDEIKRENRVVEEGVTEERALELVAQTPVACRIAAAVQAATGDNGEINEFALEMELQNAHFSIAFDKQQRQQKK